MLDTNKKLTQEEKIDTEENRINKEIKEMGSSEIRDSSDIKKILCKQIELLAEKSKECKGADLHFTSSIILDTGKYLNDYYFGFEQSEKKPLK